ncbi:hypothetical protein F4861DRAFT_493635 [Xylaria intraflava]|nr:hypothetical protein F4861DRAFT_493635 [Xylaria intraflava]
MPAGTSGPRSVADATRFTSCTPHALSKSTQDTARRLSSLNASSQQATPGKRGAMPQETMDERVRRLRAAHLAAKQHNVSRMDRVIENSRRFFDAAHKFTVMGLIGVSGIALLVTGYAAIDMMVYNRKRRTEFFAMQKQMKEDSLEAARLAYMTGTASEEQIALVEDATAKARQEGLSLPPLLSTPAAAAPAGGRVYDASSPNTAASSSEDEPGTQKGGITAWLFSGLKKEDTPYQHNAGTKTETGDAYQQINTSAVSDTIHDKAKLAYEQERENQRYSGSAGQTGASNDASAGANKKKGWLW